MEFKNALICPYCGGIELQMLATRPIMSDIRTDTFVCTNCTTQWNVYTRIAETQIEVISVPQRSEAPEEGLTNE